MTAGKAGELALLWRGNRETGAEATATEQSVQCRYRGADRARRPRGPTIYADDKADDLREQLLKLDGVLVWVDPISNGQNRTQLDGMLRDVASPGVWVSAHPDV